MKINGKEYRFNTDIRFGVIKRIQKNPEDPDSIELFIKEALVPTPTNKEIYNFKQSQVFDIMRKFGEYAQRQATEFKKKLS